MDPVTLTVITESLEKVVKITENIADSLNKLDFVVKQEFSSIGTFKETVVGLSHDVRLVARNLQTIIVSDDIALPSALFDNEASNTSLQRLLGALTDAHVLLSTRLRDFISFTSDIAKEGDSDVPSLDQIFMFSQLRAFDSVLGTDIVGLAGTRTRILQLFQEFSNLLHLHDTFKRVFFHHPFRIFIGSLYGLQLRGGRHTLRYNQTWVDRYSTAVKGVGRTWIDDHLSEITVPNTGRTQIRLIQCLKILLDRELFAFRSALPQTEKLLLEIKSGIEKEVARENNQKFTIAFCGMVKAGKSLFLNALTGCSILPSDELPSTAWPCRLRHVKGQHIPTLEIDSSYFQVAIDRLKTHKYGALMANFRVPKDADPFSEALGDIQDDDEDTEVIGMSPAMSDVKELNLRREIYSNWIDLHPTTKNNLLRFEQDDYHLPAQASGEENVCELLAQVNDVVRLCRRLNVSLPNTKPARWPLLKVEFESLLDKNIRGEFEFVDLPGIGETSCDFHNFEDLVRLVAKEANAVVPIVSFKEISKNDWRQQLPDIIKTGLGRAPELVLCTHLDQAVKDRVDQQIASVAKVFWPKSNDSRHRVICCSSRMGISARALLRRSAVGKPKFEDIWVEGRDTYDCAEKILGVGNPEQKFELLRADEWREAIVDQLTDSKLEFSVTRLTTDIVTRERGHILRLEGEQLRRKINMSIVDQQRLLLGMGRSTKEFENAYEAFRKIRSQFKQVLRNWHVDEASMQSEYSEKLQSALQVLEARSFDIATEAAERTVCQPYWHKKLGQLEDPEDLMFHRKSDVEFFLLSIQREMHLSLACFKREFVTFVRELANRSRTDLFESLKTKIQKSIKDETQNELIDGITDKLALFGQDVQLMLLSNIRKKVVHTVVSKRHNLSTAYHAIQNVIAKPLLRRTSHDCRAEDVNVTDISSAVSEASSDIGSVDASERTRDIEELGFLLRAPVAVLATIPWLLGSGVWPFMAHSKNYILNRTTLCRELQERAIRPYFDGLKREGQITLDGMTTISSQVALKAVEDALEEEEQRYAREQKQKKRPLSKVVAASSMTVLLNLLAAESGLLRLQEHLNDSLCEPIAPHIRSIGE